jgi:Lysine methyltransferase
MLTDRITLSSARDPSLVAPASAVSPEDILSSALAVIFPDDITNHHGDADNSVVYTSPLPQVGRVALGLTDPQSELERLLFGHYVWNASVQLAVFLEEGLLMDTEVVGRQSRSEGLDWSVRDKSVLELGAGSGLAGIVAAKAGACEVVISDYPAPVVLANLRANVARNLTPEMRRRCRVVGHEWGNLPTAAASSPQSLFGGAEAAQSYPGDESANQELGKEEGREGNIAGAREATRITVKPEPESDKASNIRTTKAEAENDSETAHTDPLAFARLGRGAFSRILVADCLWMPWQHASLQRSIAWFLAPAADARAWVVAGFHTGREKVRMFFETGEPPRAEGHTDGGGAPRPDAGDSDANSSLAALGLAIDAIWEVDAAGARREWVPVRGVEDVAERKRWLVVAVLRWRDGNCDAAP